METLQKIISSVEPIQYAYGVVAVVGGIARYLNSFVTGGTPFSLGILAASTVVSGFSGWMFATLGLTMGMPQGIIFIMAGSGGFFGEQTMKLIWDIIKSRTASKDYGVS